MGETKYNCEVCGEPATRIILDEDQIPDESYWSIEPEDGPWYFCDAHAGGQGFRVAKQKRVK